MMNSNRNIESNSNSSVSMASDEAPAVEAPAPFAVTVGAVNSIIITPAVLREA
jgi:hypothetical protein